MTHDELLERVSEYITSECDCESCNFINGPYKALRAVVQLHRPKDFARDTDWPWVGCMECEEQYPCDTIQDIDKELG